MTQRVHNGDAGWSQRCRISRIARLMGSRRIMPWVAIILVAVYASLPSGRLLSARPGADAQDSSSQVRTAANKRAVSAIQIEPVEMGEVGMPPEFRVAVYENLIEVVTKSGQFQHVYRSGDRAANDAPDLVTVRMKVKGFKHGSERLRQVTTVVGATTVELGVQFISRDGTVLVDRDVEGKVRFFGGNLRATYDFSKKVAKLLRQNFS